MTKSRLFEKAFHLNIMTAPTVNIYRNVKNSDVEFFILCLYECACNECSFFVTGNFFGKSHELIENFLF